MKKTLFAFLSIAISVTQIACNSSTEKKSEDKPQSAIILSELDSSVRPQDDMFDFVNHKWLAAHPIPSTESSWGIDGVIELQIQSNLKKILESAMNAKAAQGTNEQKIGDFYFTAMDSAKLDKEGITPLNDELAKIDHINTSTDLSAEVAHLHRMGMSPLFAFYVDVDSRNSSAYISQIYQAGMGMPGKDYYLSADGNMTKIKEAYKVYVQKMFTLMGMDEAAANAAMQTIMKIETDLATGSNQPVENRDPVKLYNKKSLADLNTLAPNFDWKTYFETVGMKENSIIVNQPKFLQNMSMVVKKYPAADLKIYLKWNLINSMSDALSSNFEKENFGFYRTTLRGVKEMKPRWKRSLEATDALLGEALGKLYVEQYFNKNTKAKVTAMVDYIIATYKERIMSRDWMSENTKKQAIEKLEKINRKLAYPDTFRDYSALEIKRDAFALNELRANEFEFQRTLNKLGKPIDRNEWGMTPPTINAYYNASMNEIVFPAGILEPPYFIATADDAVNYGAIGAVIGHELTHGFDDEGSQFDADGNLKNWWTADDHKKFESKTKLLVSQFNNFIGVDTFHINGELTLGENIADLGGLVIAYEALKKSQAGKKDTLIDGLTTDQRFCIAYAFSWRTANTTESLKQQIKTNPHAPAKQRVNGPLSNFAPFYAAFGVKEGDKLYVKPEQRVAIW